MANTIVHFEIPADDPEKLAAFYTGLFGWKITKMGGMPGMEDVDYWGVETVPADEQGRPTEQGVNGGLMKRMMPEQKITNYISVSNVEEYTAKAVSLGATIIMPKMAVPHMGWFAQFVDPSGNVIAIWQEDPAAA